MNAEQIGMVYRLAVRYGRHAGAQADCLSVGDIEQLFSISRTLHRLDEASCNVGLTERQEARVVQLEKKAAEIAGQAGAIAYHQSDPRGCSLYIVDPADVPAGQDVDAYYTRGIAIY